LFHSREHSTSPDLEDVPTGGTIWKTDGKADTALDNNNLTWLHKQGFHSREHSTFKPNSGPCLCSQVRLLLSSAVSALPYLIPGKRTQKVPFICKTISTKGS
jgi:hypothetical protein